MVITNCVSCKLIKYSEYNRYIVSTILWNVNLLNVKDNFFNQTEVYTEPAYDIKLNILMTSKN